MIKDGSPLFNLLAGTESNRGSHHQKRFGWLTQKHTDSSLEWSSPHLLLCRLSHQGRRFGLCVQYPATKSLRWGNREPHGIEEIIKTPTWKKDYGAWRKVSKGKDSQNRMDETRQSRGKQDMLRTFRMRTAEMLCRDSQQVVCKAREAEEMEWHSFIQMQGLWYRQRSKEDYSELAS